MDISTVDSRAHSNQRIGGAVRRVLGAPFLLLGGLGIAWTIIYALWATADIAYHFSGWFGVLAALFTLPFSIFVAYILVAVNNTNGAAFLFTTLIGYALSGGISWGLWKIGRRLW